MWHSGTRSDLDRAPSIDYQHGRPSVDNGSLKTNSSSDMRQSQHQRGGNSYPGDLRDTITNLHSKDSYHSAEGHYYDSRDGGAGTASYAQDYMVSSENSYQRDNSDLRHSISRPFRDVNETSASSLKEPVSKPFERDLRNIISGSSSVRESSLGSGGKEMSDSYGRDLRNAISRSTSDSQLKREINREQYSRESSLSGHSREAESGYYQREADCAGKSSSEYHGKDGHHQRGSRSRDLDDNEFAFLAKTLKDSVDPKLGWSKGSNPMVEQAGLHACSNVTVSQMSDYKNYQPTNVTIPQSAPYILENSTLMMNVNSTPVSISSTALKPHHTVASISSNPQLLPTSTLGMNLQANLYGGNDIMFLNSLQNRSQSVVSLAPVVMSTPLQIMEAAAVSKSGGVTLGGSFWDTIKKEGLLSYEKPFDTNLLDTTHTVGEDFQIPSLPRKTSDMKRSCSRSPIRKSHPSSRRISNDSRRSPGGEKRLRRSMSPREKHSRQVREKSPRPSNLTVSRRKSISPRRERIRSRTPERILSSGRGHKQERSRRSRETSPHLYRERSPRIGRERSPRMVRELSPRGLRKEPLRRSRELSPRIREGSPRMQRDRYRMSKERSPRMTRSRSPRLSRGHSPRLVRGTSPHQARPRREISPLQSREIPRGSPPRFSHERSPRLVRGYSAERSPKGMRRISPEMERKLRGYERSPENVRRSSPRHYGVPSPDIIRRFSPERHRNYPPKPVRIIAREGYHDEPRRSYSPVPVRILPPERESRYPRDDRRRHSPQHYGRHSTERKYPPVRHSSPCAKQISPAVLGPKSKRQREQSPFLRDINSPPHELQRSPPRPSGSPQVARRVSPEEDRESPRRSWDTRNRGKRNRGNKTRPRKINHKPPRELRSRELILLKTDSVSSRETLASSLERSQDTPTDNLRSSPFDLAREASPISLGSNDDQDFGEKDLSPLFDEVSLSPGSAKPPSPGTPTSDERQKPFLDSDLQRGCSPVSLSELPLEQAHKSKSQPVDLQRDLSPVSLDEDSLGRRGGERENRSKSPLSDASHGSLIVTDSIGVQDSPQPDGDKDSEDLRVHLLRMREEKVELKLKKLEEESLETELRLQNLSPDILDYSPQRDTPSPLLDECEDERRPEGYSRKFYGY